MTDTTVQSIPQAAANAEYTSRITNEVLEKAARHLKPSS